MSETRLIEIIVSFGCASNLNVHLLAVLECAASHGFPKLNADTNKRMPSTTQSYRTFSRVHILFDMELKPPGQTLNVALAWDAI